MNAAPALENNSGGTESYGLGGGNASDINVLNDFLWPFDQSVFAFGVVLKFTEAILTGGSQSAKSTDAEAQISASLDINASFGISF